MFNRDLLFHQFMEIFLYSAHRKYSTNWCIIKKQSRLYICPITEA